MATPRHGKDTPAKADPRRGANPGYAEDQPRDSEDARQPAIPSRPNPDDAGIEHREQTDVDPAKGRR
jgi:hypothetical protein